MMSKELRNLGFVLTASATLSGALLSGCSRENDSYTPQTSREVAYTGGRKAPNDPKLQDFFNQAYELDEALVNFLNSMSAYIGNSSYHYSTDKSAFEKLRADLIQMEETVVKLIESQREMSPADRNIFVEYSEALGEGRGAIFDARSYFGYRGEVQFSGEGMNELHGLRTQTQAILAAFARPPQIDSGR